MQLVRRAPGSAARRAGRPIRGRTRSRILSASARSSSSAVRSAPRSRTAATSRRARRWRSPRRSPAWRSRPPACMSRMRSPTRSRRSSTSGSRRATAAQRLIPHGFAVAVTAPAVFRFIEDSVPERCATAARLLDGGDDLAVSLEPPARRRRRAPEPARARVRRGRSRRGRSGALDQQRLLVLHPEGDRRRRAPGAARERRCEMTSGRAASRSSALGRWAPGSPRCSPPTASRRDSSTAPPRGARLRRARALELLSRLEEAGHVGAGAVATAEASLSAAASVEAGVGGADLIVEAVVERPDVKATRVRRDRSGCRKTAPSSPRTPPRSRLPSSLPDCSDPPGSSGCTGSCRRSSFPASRRSPLLRPATRPRNRSWKR